MRRLQQTWLTVFVLGFSCAWLHPAAGADKKTDPTGTWKWERTRGDNTRQYTLRIKLKDDKVTGTYASRRNDADNETTIENAKLDGDELSFRVTREFNDRKLTINMQGKVSEDAITGTGAFDFDGNAREFEWLAKRSVDAKDVAGTWNFRIETDNGNVLEPVITFTEKDGKLAGAYEGRSGEREVKKIVIKDNQLTFEISGENNGNEWNVVYKGKPRGNSINGTIDYDFGGNSGTVEFVGKRAPEKKKEVKGDDGDDDDDKDDDDDDNDEDDDEDR